MSLPLADQKLGSHSNPDSTSHKFMLKGRQSGGIHRGHAWVFRAESYDTMMAWFSDVKNLTEKTGEERNAFIRRSHARSLSGSSQKAPSVNSDDRALDEDEADQVPYSATASQADVHQAPEEKLPQRPNPGGRFPSTLNINRDSQVPLSPSSPSSSGDREIIAAAGALPGSGVPFGNPGQPVQFGEDHTQDGRGEVGVGASTAPTTFSSNVFSPVSQTLPPLVSRHDSKYGDWMAPVAAGGIAANALKRDQQLKESKDDIQPSLQAVEAPTVPPPAAAAVAATSSSTTTTTAGLFSTSGSLPPSAPSHTEDPAAPIRNLAHTSDPASPIKDLAKRPQLESHPSVATISDLHVPGEFPKGGAASSKSDSIIQEEAETKTTEESAP